MKKNTILILGAVAVGTYFLLAMRRKRPAYRIDVPAPERITAEEFERPATERRTIVQRVAPIVQSLLRVDPTRRAARQTRRATRRAARRVGEFPEMF